MGQVVFIALTLDCCVLCTAQELSCRGYPVRCLAEAVDTHGDSAAEKRALLQVPLANWGRPISWQQFRQQTGG